MENLPKETLKKAISKFPEVNILVIGDIIIDHFIWGSVSRISPEAPVPVVNVKRENLLLGGAANVLNNIYALGGKASLCGVIGQDIMGNHIVDLLKNVNSPVDGVIKSGDRPTTKKTRIIAQQQQVVRFDREKTGPFPEEIKGALLDYLDKNLASFQAVVVSDYNKGMINRDTMAHLMKKLSSQTTIPVIADPKPKDIDRFAGSTILTPNNHEAELMSGMEIRNEKDLRKAADIIFEKTLTKALLITRGEEGMALFEKDNEPFFIPTVAREVFDVTGAGDTVVASLALGLAGGLSFIDASILANQAAGIVVGKLGTATASPEEITGAIS